MAQVKPRSNLLRAEGMIRLVVIRMHPSVTLLYTVVDRLQNDTNHASSLQMLNAIVAPKISPYAVLVRQCRSSCVPLCCSLFRSWGNSGNMAHGILNGLTEGGAEHERFVTTLTVIKFEIITEDCPFSYYILEFIIHSPRTTYYLYPQRSPGVESYLTNLLHIHQPSTRCTTTGE